MSGDSNNQNDVLRAQLAATDPMAKLTQEMRESLTLMYLPAHRVVA